MSDFFHVEPAVAQPPTTTTTHSHHLSLTTPNTMHCIAPPQPSSPTPLSPSNRRASTMSPQQSKQHPLQPLHSPTADDSSIDDKENHCSTHTNVSNSSIPAGWDVVQTPMIKYSNKQQHTIDQLLSPDGLLDGLDMDDSTSSANALNSSNVMTSPIPRRHEDTPLPSHHTLQLSTPTTPAINSDSSTDTSHCKSPELTKIHQLLSTDVTTESHNKSWLLQQDWLPTEEQQTFYNNLIDQQCTEQHLTRDTLLLKCMIERDNALSTVDELSERHAALRTNLQELDAVFEQKSNRLTYALEENEALQQQLQQLAADNSTLLTENSTVNAELQRLDTEYQNVMDQYEKIQPEYEKRVAEKRQMKQELAAMAEECDKHQLMYEELKNAAPVAAPAVNAPIADSSLLTDLQSQLAGLQKQLAERDQQIEALQNATINHTVVSRQSVRNNATPDDNDEFVNQLQAEILELAQTIGAAHTAQTEAERKLQAKAAEHTELQAKLTAKDAENQQLSEDLKRVWKRKSDDLLELEQYKQRYSTTAARNTLLSQTISKLETTITDLSEVTQSQSTIQHELDIRAEHTGVKHNELLAELQYYRCEAAEKELAVGELETTVVEWQEKYDEQQQLYDQCKEQLIVANTNIVESTLNTLVDTTIHTALAQCNDQAMQQLTTTYQRLQHEHVTLQEMHEHLQTEYTLTTEHSNSLAAEVHALNLQLSVLTKDKLDLIEFSNVEQTLKEELEQMWTTKYNDSQAQLTARAKELSDSQQQYTEVTARLAQTDEKLAAAQQQLQELEFKLVEETTALQHAIETNQAAHQQQSDLSAQTLRDKQQHIAELEKQISADAATVQSLQSDITQLQSELAAQRDELRTATQTVADVQLQNKSAVGDRDVVQQKVMMLEQQLDSAMLSEKNAVNDRMELRTELEKMQAKYSDSKTSNKKLLLDVQTAQNELLAVQASLSRLQAAAPSAGGSNAERLRSAEAELSELHAQQLQARSRVAQLEGLLESKEQAQSQVQTQLQSLLATRCTDCGSIHSTEDKQCPVAVLYTQYQTAVDQLKLVETERNQLIAVVETMHAATSNLQSRGNGQSVIELADRMDDVARSNSKLQSQMEELSKSNSELQVMLKEVVRTLRDGVSLIQRSKQALVRLSGGEEAQTDDELRFLLQSLTKYYGKQQLLLQAMG